jgi:RNA polymerase sigma-70 factor (ECF subfamily)
VAGLLHLFPYSILKKIRSISRFHDIHLRMDASPIPPPHLDSRQSDFVERLTASHGKLLGYLLSLLGRWHDAQDVLQKASLVMWQKFDAFEPGSDFVAWASTICFYEAKNFQRLTARSPFSLSPELLETLARERLTDLPHQDRRMLALERCLNSLPSETRHLLETAYASHGGIAEMAAQLNRAPRTLYNKLNHLRRQLAECVLSRLQEESV